MGISIAHRCSWSLAARLDAVMANPNAPHVRMCINATDSDPQGVYDTLRRAFWQRGYRTKAMWPEHMGMSMCEQLAAVAKSDIVIHSHGSFAGNLVALMPHTSVITLQPYEYLEEQEIDTGGAVRRCEVCERNASSPACLTGSPHLIAAPARHQTRTTIFGRDQPGQMRVALQAAGIDVKLVTIPADRWPGRFSESDSGRGLWLHRESDWGCLSPAALVDLAIVTHARGARGRGALRGHRERPRVSASEAAGKLKFSVNGGTVRSVHVT